MAFYFLKKSNLVGSGEQFEKKIPFFRSNNLFLLIIWKFYLYGSLSGQGIVDKKSKIRRIKAKIIYFEASKYGENVKNLEFLENFSVLELE